MGEAEMRGLRIHDTDAAPKFITAYAKGKEGGLEGHFAAWSPFRTADVHVEQHRFRDPLPACRVDGYLW